ncbi:MAG: DUF4416 family protein [Nitrospirota bacterium]
MSALFGLMGIPSQPEEVLLFVGALFQNGKYLASAKEKLKESFGEILVESPLLEWNYSDYYKEEMGWPLKRIFLFFKKRICPENLPEIKLTTNNIERQFSTEGRRNINIDPGYLTLSKVVLASTKNYSHRIYLGKGIYAEVTLIYRNNRFQPHLFTYRDYASDTYAEIFARARRLLKES